MFALEPRLSPSLESIETDLKWLLLFEPKLFDDINIDSKDVNTVIPAILNCCYQFIDSKACDIICTDRFDDCGDYLEMLAVTLQYIASDSILFKLIERLNRDWQPSTVIPLAISDPEYSRYFAAVITQIDKQKLVQDTANKLHFADENEFIESLKKDKIHCCETAQGWLLPEIWKQLQKFGTNYVRVDSNDGRGDVDMDRDQTSSGYGSNDQTLHQWNSQTTHRYLKHAFSVEKYCDSGYQNLDSYVKYNEECELLFFWIKWNLSQKADIEMMNKKNVAKSKKKQINQKQKIWKLTLTI